MRKKGASCWMLVSAVILTLFVSFCGTDCSAPYHPELYGGYDILNPSAEVKANPLGFTEDGNLIVNDSLILYVYELRQEIRYLRARIAELERKLK